MADFEKYAAKVLQLEGGYVNNPQDKGGPTKYGVILETWRRYGYDEDGDGDIDADDIKLITEEDAKQIVKKIFWDFFEADMILNQSIAEFIVDWGYNSGRGTVARIIQRIIQVAADGQFGKLTLATINGIQQEAFFQRIVRERKDFIDNIVKREPDQHIFYRGWMNRINSFHFAE